MSKVVVRPDGSYTIGVTVSEEQLVQEEVELQTVPPTYDMNGEELTPAIVPNADDVAQIFEVDDETILPKHEWMLPRHREDKKEEAKEEEAARVVKGASAETALTSRLALEVKIDASLTPWDINVADSSHWP